MVGEERLQSGVLEPVLHFLLEDQFVGHTRLLGQVYPTGFVRRGRVGVGRGGEVETVPAGTVVAVEVTAARMLRPVGVLSSQHHLKSIGSTACRIVD